MRFRSVSVAALLLLPIALSAQFLDPNVLKKPNPVDAWPTYHGDYSGKRYSELTQINKSNVNTLTLAWEFKALATAESANNVGGPWKPGDPTYWGGPSDSYRIAGSPLMVDGVMYISAMDRAWAINARTGEQLWSYFFKTRGGHHFNGNKGMGMYGSWLYFVTPDAYLVSLDAKTGKERWYKQLAPVEMDYYGSTAPLVVGNHVYTGIGGDALDIQGYLEARDPETGEVQWKWYSTPQNPGDPGYDSWPDDYSRKHGGGGPWQPLTYVPALNLIYVTTGNPNPVGATQSRKGDNLYTCSIVALNADTGKMAWYYQTSPHDMHDYDSAQTPVLVDGMFNGKMRKMLLTAARNGYWFTLDRVTGEHLVTSKYGLLTNWSNRLTKAGGPFPDPGKNATIAGSLVSPTSDGTTNWEPPSYSPDTGLFYVAESDEYSIFYLTDVDPRGSMGLGGKDEVDIGSGGSFLTAIDYRSGEVKWRRPYYGQGGGGGMLTTAGKLLFAGDGAGNLVAHDVVTGKPLWNTRIGGVTNPAQTYMLDGRQYVIAATADTIWSFVLY